MSADMSINEPTGVFFAVKQDESGCPSVSREEIWCLPVEGDNFVVDNIPFYARDVSMGDEVITEVRNGERWFVSISKPSGNTTLRMFERSPGSAPYLTERMRSFGCVTEEMDDSPLLAASFPPSADLKGALDFLDTESNEQRVAFEESSIRYR